MDFVYLDEIGVYWGMNNFLNNYGIDGAALRLFYYSKAMYIWQKSALTWFFVFMHSKIVETGFRLSFD